jgi:hypothetical protein
MQKAVNGSTQARKNSPQRLISSPLFLARVQIIVSFAGRLALQMMFFEAERGDFLRKQALHIKIFRTFAGR